MKRARRIHLLEEPDNSRRPLALNPAVLPRHPQRYTQDGQTAVGGLLALPEFFDSAARSPPSRRGTNCRMNASTLAMRIFGYRLSTSIQV